MRSEEDEVSDKHYHPTSLPLQSQRYLSDISHYDHGLYVHKLVNKGKHPIDSIFLQDWFMNNFRPHMQSLTLFRKRAGSSFTEEYSLYSLERGRSDLKFDANIQYSATSDSHITMSLRGDKAVLQPDDSLMITFEVRKALRNFEEYPNDIARGLNIPHMPIYYTEEAQGQVKMVMSEGILAQTPEPDFSMPFNVNAVTHMIFGVLFVNTIFSIFSDP
mmetsp:Transcript_12768/g.19770  ORF Transcript_12768/g.19770 Transcript_12768/m.19770 type:complete len:217 (+) Transcript_12768:916-1566(+)